MFLTAAPDVRSRTRNALECVRMRGFSYLKGRPRCFTKSHTLQEAGDQRYSLVPRLSISPMNSLGTRLGDCYITQEMDAFLHAMCLYVIMFTHLRSSALLRRSSSQFTRTLLNSSSERTSLSTRGSKNTCVCGWGGGGCGRGVWEEREGCGG